jgi:hypothetical protein
VSTSTHWGPNDNDAFKARAISLAGVNVDAYSVGGALIQSLSNLTNRVGPADLVGVFGHAHPPGIIGQSNNSGGLYISSSGNYTAYKQKYELNGEMKSYNYDAYFKPDGTPVNKDARARCKTSRTPYCAATSTSRRAAR